MKKKIVKIDESKCNGCGACVPNCHEGVIKIINGKAKLVDEAGCDGVGACLGHCPQGAISIEEKEIVSPAFCGCPGMKVRSLSTEKQTPAQLNNWPIQLKLVPISAPYFNNAELLIAADCTAFSFAAFHQNLLKGKVLLIACPKLDDLNLYNEKIFQIIQNNNIKSVTYVHMEVPCCTGLIKVIQNAIAQSGKKLEYKDLTVSIEGELIKN